MLVSGLRAGVVLSVLLQWTTPFVAGSPRAGIQFDSSCDAYSDILNQTMIATANFAKAGFKEASTASNPRFAKYFRAEDMNTVKVSMRNINKLIRGHGSPILVKCNEDNECLSATDAYASVPGKWINICRHGLEGPRKLPVAIDYCQQRSEPALSNFFFHELLHMPSITDGIETEDYGYYRPQCVAIANGEMKDDKGQVVLPTHNVNNYNFMAFESLWNAYLASPVLCPTNTNNELRKLQAANVTSIVDGSTVGAASTTKNVTELDLNEIRVPEAGDLIELNLDADDWYGNTTAPDAGANIP